MTPQETELLNEFLFQLTQVRGVPKDPAADALIAKAVTQQPDAAYLLVQRSLLLDQAVDAATQRIEQLETELRNIRAPAPAATGGFLSGMSAWGRKPTAAASAAPAFAGARSLAPQPLASGPQVTQTGGSGSFLGRAAATAAGVVGGAFLFQGISQLMGNRAHTPESGAQASSPATADGLTSNSFASDPVPEANVDSSIPLEQYDTAMDDSARSDDSSSEA